MSSLFQINEAIENAFRIDETGEYVDALTGEIFDGSYIDSLFEERNEKIKNVVLYIKNLTAEAEAVQKQKMIFDARQKALKNRIESLKGYLSGNIAEGEKINEAEFTLSWRKSESVEVFNIKALQTDDFEHFLKYKEPEVDKTAVKKAIKEGKAVPGCTLMVKQNLQIK